MAAYAALVSLFNILDQIKNHPRFFASVNKYQIESLGERIDFFLDFVERYNSDGAGELESQIVSAAHEAEDVLESHIVDQILVESYNSDGVISEENAEDLESQIASADHEVDQVLSGATEINDICLFGLQKVILDIDSLKNKVLKVKKEREFYNQRPTNSMPATSSASVATGKDSMVGFDNELWKLMDMLIGNESSREIITIVGMGGIGKTTLAKNVYEDSLVIHHFDLRAWYTISQEYNVREILLELLSLKEKFTQKTVDELGERLYKSLSGRRYLIILDDMWDIEVWDNIKIYFPDNRNGSRIVLTTRLSNVAILSRSFCIRINFLDEYESWELFCQKVFGEEDCPPMLVRIGKKIVEQCKGLPLSIVVMGGLLRMSYRTEEYWQKVAKNINSLLNSREDRQCLDVLYLSYSHLPAHLKPCFLYMGTYREDSEIRVSEMINLWVAEGFLKPNGMQSLEEIAEDYLKDLIDRNLILVSGHRSNGKIRSLRIHDLLRELCLWVANKEKFFCLASTHSIPRGINRERRVIFHGPYYNIEDLEGLQSVSLTRSLICYAAEVPLQCRLLRVLNKVFGWSEFKNINLRYFAYLPYLISKRVVLSSSISLIWNLQTLIIQANQVIVAPLEIWNMSQLRHLKCFWISLPYPSPIDEQDDSVVLGNLQTLAVVANFWLSEEVCRRIPNVKKLHIAYDDIWEGYDNLLYDNLCYLGRLHKLESLNIWCSWTTLIPINVLKNAFSSSLIKLSLRGCILHWEDLSRIIGYLPHLEVLKLKDPFSKVCNWSCIEGEFLRLKFLQIESSDLKSWTLDSESYFPVLEKLVLVDLWNLNEIPSSIGEIPTLLLVRLEDCSDSAVISAMRMKEEQESFGNDGLMIKVMKRKVEN